MSGPADSDIVALATLQFSWGGLFDSSPADGWAVHLVRYRHRGGTPGPTLCGIDRFAKDGPGWSVGGGVSGQGITHTPCLGCLAAAQQEFPGLPVVGIGHRQVARELCVASYRSWHNLPKGDGEVRAS